MQTHFIPDGGARRWAWPGRTQDVLPVERVVRERAQACLRARGWLCVKSTTAARSAARPHPPSFCPLTSVGAPPAQVLLARQRHDQWVHVRQVHPATRQLVWSIAREACVLWPCRCRSALPAVLRGPRPHAHRARAQGKPGDEAALSQPACGLEALRQAAPQASRREEWRWEHADACVVKVKPSSLQHPH